MKEENDRFLIMRNGRWHYNRRVPGRYFAVESRRFIRSSLKTKSLDVARMRRDALEEADNAYWQALMLDKAQGNERSEIRKVMHQRYEAGRSRALAFGFSYKPMQALLEKESVEEILDRLKVLETSAGQKPFQMKSTPKPYSALLLSQTDPIIESLMHLLCMWKKLPLMHSSRNLRTSESRGRKPNERRLIILSILLAIWSWQKLRGSMP